MTDEFLAPEWSEILKANGLGDFDALWALEAGWFEEPNVRRGGWSGVSRFDLVGSKGEKLGIFIKRQENHPTWSWRHPIRGIPTFQREFRRILRYKECGVPSLEPIYFGTRMVGKDLRAILISRELVGFRSMEDRSQEWLTNGAPGVKKRRTYLAAIAKVLQQMHAHGIQHNCFFPKHVFIREDATGAIEVRVIDLEKSRWRPAKTICATRDLYGLIRHSQYWSLSDSMYFYLQYLGKTHLDAYGKWLWRRIVRKAQARKRITSGQPKLTAVRADSRATQ